MAVAFKETDERMAMAAYSGGTIPGVGERIEPATVPQAWMSRLGDYEIANEAAGLSDGYAQLLQVDPDSVAPYLGKYESLAGHLYSIEWRDGGLWFGQGPLDNAQLLASPEGGYAAISPGGVSYLPVRFVESQDGNITLVIAGAIEAPKVD